MLNKRLLQLFCIKQAEAVFFDWKIMIEMDKSMQGTDDNMKKYVQICYIISL